MRQAPEKSKSIEKLVIEAPTHKHGPVMAIGGAEDRTSDGEILGRFVEIAGGDQAHILIIPTASEDPAKAGKTYIDVFGKHGVKQVDVLDIDDRVTANDPSLCERLEKASGVFITGGDQARLVTRLFGTAFSECLRVSNAKGVAVGGTSAGASAVSSHMMLGGTGEAGNSNDAAARKGMVDTVAGLGLVEDMVIDQHFSERGRMGRLLSAFAANPGLIGIGLDQDTAVIIDSDDIAEVVGTGMVTIVDGRMPTSDYFDKEVGDVLTVTGSTLHVLSPGRRFDLRERRALEADCSKSG